MHCVNLGYNGRIELHKCRTDHATMLIDAPASCQNGTTILCVSRSNLVRLQEAIRKTLLDLGNPECEYSDVVFMPDKD
ncbi:MAG: hypothetical protein WC373_13650 [Smithella sp.]